jgi:hypothetical protein
VYTTQVVPATVMPQEVKDSALAASTSQEGATLGFQRQKLALSPAHVVESAFLPHA